MIWRSTAQILVSFVVAGVIIWFSPLLCGLLGLGEFAFVGQLGLTILALSVLDRVFRRIPGSSDH
jgi:hypothetical protein